ncbi:unnamed protein product [Brassica oleracea]
MIHDQYFCPRSYPFQFSLLIYIFQIQYVNSRKTPNQITEIVHSFGFKTLIQNWVLLNVPNQSRVRFLRKQISATHIIPVTRFYYVQFRRLRIILLHRDRFWGQEVRERVDLNYMNCWRFIIIKRLRCKTHRKEKKTKIKSSG